MATGPESDGSTTAADDIDAPHCGARWVSILNRREFCRMYGLSDDEIAAIREGQFEAFTPAEVALLRMADAMADTPSNVSDELYQELRRHFSEEQLIELAVTAALENFRARSNRVFDVGSDGLYRKGLRFKER